MYTKEDVQHLIDELAKREFDPPIELGEPYMFGQALDLYDPVSGWIIALARPHRHDLGDHPQVLLTAAQVATEIASARANRSHTDRANGFATPEAAVAARKAAADERDLRMKHLAELAELRNKQDGERVAAAEKLAKDSGGADVQEKKKKADEATRAADDARVKAAAAQPADKAELDRVYAEKKAAAEAATADFDKARVGATKKSADQVSGDRNRPNTAEGNARVAAGEPSQQYPGTDQNRTRAGENLGGQPQPGVDPRGGPIGKDDRAPSYR